MLLSQNQNAWQNHVIEIANKSFENAAQFKYLGTIEKKRLIQEKITSRLNMGNTCYHLVHNILSSCLTLRKEHRLWVSENRVLKRIFGPNKDESQEV
jgi:hypothetical protein